MSFDVFSSANEEVQWHLTAVQINWHIDGDSIGFSSGEIIKQLRKDALSSDVFDLEIKVQAIFTARCEVVILVIRYLHESSRLLLNASKMGAL